MLFIKKLKFTKQELAEIGTQLDGYIWATIDAKRGVISAGDEFVQDLRDALMIRRCHPEDIFGFGLDLKTGRIDYLPACNRRNPTLNCRGEIPEERKERIETLIHYFFNGLAVYANRRDEYPRLPRKPSSHNG